MLSAFVGYGNIHGAMDHTLGEQPELDLKSGEVESRGQSPQRLSLRWIRVQGNAGLKRAFRGRLAKFLPLESQEFGGGAGGGKRKNV
jgi:hypothetical protein